MIRNGQRGRPRIGISPSLLSETLEGGRGPSQLEGVFECSRRTIRRRALEAGLVPPGKPVFSWEDVGNDEEILVHTSQSKPVSTLQDHELDDLIRSVQVQISELGAPQLRGALLRLGHRVPRERISKALLRINGIPGIFGNRQPKHRRYANRAPLACVHHDGQHGEYLCELYLRATTLKFGESGLIRYRIVIHCFVDGFSRYILGIKAHDNNRAQTVLDLFMDRVVNRVGVPDKVRGDHGVENLKVAEFMRNELGPENKPYLWGACVFTYSIEMAIVSATQVCLQEP